MDILYYSTLNLTQKWSQIANENKIQRRWITAINFLVLMLLQKYHVADDLFESYICME
jgi:hypothetical protein